MESDAFALRQAIEVTVGMPGFLPKCREESASAGTRQGHWTDAIAVTLVSDNHCQGAAMASNEQNVWEKQ